MDLSALIFVALAVAWAVYLVPKALRHHDDVARTRSVDRFSHTMRVLARREPISPKSARLVVTPGRPAAEAVPAPAQREATRRATRRRRNVLGVILVALLATVGVAAFGVIAWSYVAIPAAVLVAWLVTCRIMVRGERSRMRLARTPDAKSPEDEQAEASEGRVLVEEEEHDDIDPLADTSAGLAAVVDPALWDPVPVTLPTYVGKPAATRRTVRTIDLEGTGVWTSGRTEADAALAREADEAERADRAARGSRENGERATGS